VAHVELSLTEPLVPTGVRDIEPATNLDRWAAAVAHAAEPCLVIDSGAVILATSASCCDLFGLDDPPATIGRYLLSNAGGALQLVDFTAERGELAVPEVDKIPPLLALTSGRPAHGLMRVQCGRDPERICTVDAIATPILEGPRPAGSLTFFCEI
jgi:hypothetical protein